MKRSLGQRTLFFDATKVEPSSLEIQLSNIKKDNTEGENKVNKEDDNLALVERIKIERERWKVVGVLCQVCMLSSLPKRSQNLRKEPLPLRSEGRLYRKKLLRKTRKEDIRRNRKKSLA